MKGKMIQQSVQSPYNTLDVMMWLQF